ncbi:amino acid adenylation domain-containing protein [Streptomyces sp. NPDC056387]|uniref:amino acid adenylation domain-containing protein n=1 Tax=Streptomyces sp. NPDC056387 TaxID=3345803 RepID=UPI0035E3603B
MWRAWEIDPERAVFRGGEYIEIHGPVDRILFEAALQQAVTEADTLHVRFGVDNGEPWQTVGGAPAWSIDFVDVSSEPEPRAAAERMMRQELSVSLNLYKDRLFGHMLFRVAADRYFWFHHQHHLVMDGASTTMIVRRVAELYTALVEDRSPNETPFGSVRELFEEDAAYRRSSQYADDGRYWRERFADNPTPTQLSSHAGSGPAEPLRHTGYLSPHATEAVRAALSRTSARLSRLAIAAMAGYVHRLTGNRDVVLSMAVTARTTPLARTTPGMRTNVLPLRLDLRPGMSGAELLANTADGIRELLAHQRYWGDQLSQDLGRPVGFGPSVNVWPFNYDLTFGGFRTTTHNMSMRHVEDLLLSVYDRSDGNPLRIDLDGNTARHSPDELRTHHDHFLVFLEHLAASIATGDGPIGGLDLLGPTRRRQVLEQWNDTARDVPTAHLADLFEARAHQAPDAIAVRHGASTVTYRELNERANRLAHRLIARGIGPEQVVALALPRSPGLLVAMLATLKAGAAYLAVDPEYPAGRVAFILDDARPVCLLTTEEIRSTLPGHAIAELVLDPVDAPDDRDGHPVTDPTDADRTNAVSPLNTAYVIYTSGSTGVPKAVTVTHTGVPSLASLREQLRMDETSKVLQFLSPSFDGMFWEVFITLLAGATVSMAPTGRELVGPALGELVREQGITHLALPPSMLAELPADSLPTGITLVVASEACPPELVQRWSKDRLMLNSYGPSEMTVCATLSDPLRGRAVPPIGKPIANAQVFVLDAALQPVPVGTVGELYLSGPGLARGYLRRPGTTAGRFVANPFGKPGTRIYRTGDLARWRHDGELEFVGRVDRQVKLRGFRVELDEVETVITRLDAVAQAAVVVHTAPSGHEHLVAYVVPAPGAVVDAGQVRASVADALPSYMVPSGVMMMHALPRTPNGKLDRDALPAPAPERSPDSRVAPRNDREEALCRLFAKVLGIPEVGVDDNFFDLGGHSLLAARLVTAIRSELGEEVRVATVFDMPTAATLARCLGADGPGRTALRPSPHEGPVPLSAAQRQLWLQHQLEGPSATYNTPLVLRLSGELDIEALQAALVDLVTRHEALRTVVRETDGIAHQVVLDPAGARPELTVVPAEESRMPALLADAVRYPFDLSSEPPVRASLFVIGPAEHVFLLLPHHIACDELSLRPLARDLATAYGARVAGGAPSWQPLSVSYSDYTLWQERRLGSASDPDSRLARHLAYWNTALAGLPDELGLSFDRQRPAVATHRGAAVPVQIDEPTHQALARLAKDGRSSVFMVVQAAFAALLTRMGAGTDIPIGSPVAGRDEQVLDDLVGCFVNTVVLRTDTSHDPTFRELLARVRAADLAAYDHQDVPFDHVVEVLSPRRSLARQALFQVMLAFQTGVEPDFTMPGLSTTLESVQLGAAKFDLALNLSESTAGGQPAGISGVLNYSTDLFTPHTAEALVKRLGRVLSAMAENPDQRLSAPDLLSDEERAALTAPWAPAVSESATIVERFERQVRRAPGGTAVRSGEVTITYAQLNAQANRLARWLIQRGAGPERYVAISLPRSADLVVAILAVLKTGAAYLPIDPENPVERTTYITADAAPCWMLDRLPDDLASWPEHDVTDEDRNRPLLPAHPAYVIYTSGSTGQPKGVAVPHHNVVRLFDVTRERFGFGPTDVWTLFHSFAFDFSVWELWGALLHGGRLVVVSYETSRAPEDFLELVAAEGVTVLNQTPSAFHQFIAADAAHPEWSAALRLRFVIFGGEALDPARLRAWFERHADDAPALVNMYGITETTVHVTDLALERRHADEPHSSPIGTPLPDLRGHVLDERLRPVPFGLTGELYVAGAGLARGYISRPGLTARRFVADPFGVPGSRMYRTGDLVRRRADGVLEFVGRADDQVKVRGFRIELGEIESALVRHPAVAQAAVVVREDRPGDRRLAAYVVPAGEQGVTGAELREFAGQWLPTHMMPSAVVTLDALPLTVNGKLDRRALPAPEPRDLSDGRAPRTPHEAVLCGLFAEVLGSPAVSIDDDFFALGGHSLLATRLVGRVRAELGVDLPVRAVFEAPSVHRLVRRLEEARPARPALRRRELPDRMPLSFAQRRMWFLSQMEGPSATYNMPLVLRLSGSVDVTAMRAALRDVAQRHETLRTVFGDHDGEPYQELCPASAMDLPVTDVAETELTAALEDEVRRGFDLSGELPLRARMFALPCGDHAMTLVLHHIAADGWSVAVLGQDLAMAYAARRAGRAPSWPLHVRYADYAAWQRELLGDPEDQDSEIAAQTAYWAGALAGIPECLRLPTDRPRPAVASHRGASFTFDIDAATHRAIGELALSHRVTPFMVVQAALAALLTRLGAGTDIPLGVPIAGRGDGALNDAVGYFVNTLVLRTDTSDDPTFTQLLDRVKETSLAAYAHQDVPFEHLVEQLNPARSLSHHPLFQVMLAFQNNPTGSFDLTGLTVERQYQDTGVAKFDLSFAFREHHEGAPEGILGAVEYATDLFDRGTVERIVARLLGFLAAVTADPDTPIGRVEVMTPAETHTVLVRWNDTARPNLAPTLPQAFSQQAARTPDRTAVTHGDLALSYAELDARVNRLAHFLIERGAGPERFVAVLLPRSAELIVAVLAVARSGAAFVPMDPDQPAERVAFTTRDAGAVFGLTTVETARDTSLPGDIPWIALDDDDIRRAVAGYDGAASHPTPSPRTPAYAIYTSGSTGRPKGVAVEHRSLADYLAWAGQAYPGASGTALLHSPVSFDLTITTLLLPLTVGGRICVADLDDTFPIRDEITFCKITPSHLPLLAALPDAYAPTKDLVIGGEQLLSEALTEWRRRHPEVTVVNEYGPTEATVGAVAYQVRPGATLPAGAVPVGRPAWNTEVYVLDEQLRLVPPGVVGELYLAGAGLARGYLGRPGTTAERFIANPFPSPAGDAGGARMYRTGDLARWRLDGELEYVGRSDEQVKIRGHRVELGEIEARISADPQVGAAAVKLSVVAPDDQRLVGYVVPNTPDAYDPAALRDALARSLPAYMLPTAFVTLDALPMTANGKVDRRALPDPEFPSAVASRAPRGPRERLLCRLFAEVLGVPEVGVHDDFFALGGHSLLATRLVSRIRSTMGAELPIRALFEAPTVERLIRLLDTGRAATDVRPELVRAERPEEIPLSYAQRRLWFLSRLEEGAATYNIPLGLRLTGPLDRGALIAALHDVIDRHESLRTVFPERLGVPRQVILDTASAWEGLAEVACSVDEMPVALARAARHAFDLTVEAPLRTTLFALGPGQEDHVLLLVLHHIAGDGWSMAPLARDLADAYTARRSGAVPAWQPLPVQYADYTLWQRQFLGSEQNADSALNRQLDFWLRALDGLPDQLELPADRPRPATASLRGGTVPLEVPAAQHRALLRVARDQGASLFMVAQAALAALLSRLGAGTDIPLGSPIAGRTSEELDDLIGYFSNTVVLRVDTSGNPRMTELIRRVREVNLAVHAHQDLPFEHLVDAIKPARSLARHPLFQVMLMFQNTPPADPRLAGVTTTRQHIDSGVAKFDLSFGLAERHTADGVPDGLTGVLEYASDLFDESTAEALAARLQRVLAAVAEHPAQAVGQLDLLAAEERATILERWNDTAAPPLDDTLPALFEAQVARTPHAPAVRCDGDEWDFSQLNSRANRLARHLVRAGVGTEDLVALALPRTPELVVAVWAVLKAGAAYLPLDPSHPAERLALMVRDAAPVCAVTVAAAASALPDGTRRVVLDDEATVRALEDLPDDDLTDADRVRPLTPAHIAYAIFTSGSTGRPKAVVVPQRNVVDLAAWAHRELGVDTLRTVAATTSLNFDVSVFELFAPLLCGGSIELVADAPALAERGGWTGGTLSTVPSVMAALLADPGASAHGVRPRALLYAGEALPARLVQDTRAALPECRILNVYGPTEATVYALFADVGPDENTAPPIGGPLRNTRAYVLDDGLRLVPSGAVGELYLAGEPRLARGYHNRPALTAERFVADPFGHLFGESGARMYRTGDLVRRRADGSLDFLGRADDQVKIRGFRVEPGEAEAVLAAHPDIARAVVLVRDDGPTGPQLVAYLVPVPGRLVEWPDVRRFAAQRLPDYLLPARAMMLDTLPLNPNGKVDRRALPAPAPVAGGSRPARTPEEVVLCDIIAELLSVPEVTADANFFELGGDSIVSIQLVSRARARGLLFTPRDVFEQQTVAELAVVARTAPSRTAEEPSEAGIGAVPPTPIMHWLRELGGPTDGFNQAVLVQVPAGSRRHHLATALQALLDHHDALRMRMSRRTGAEWGLEIQPPGSVRAEGQLRHVDVAGLDEPELTRRISEEGELARRRLSPADGVMTQCVLFDAGPGQAARLLLVAHHLVVDGVSWRILLSDLALAWEHAVTGRTPELPPVGTSFRRWAQRLADLADEPGRLDELVHWEAVLSQRQVPLGVTPQAGHDTMGTARRLRMVLPAHRTSPLLTRVPTVVNGQVNDVLLTGLALAVTTWQRRSGHDDTGDVVVDLESHGRQEMPGTDVSRTVGWFTSMYPVRLAPGTVPPGELRDGGPGVGRALKRIKEQLRALPDNGTGFGLLRHLHPEGRARLGGLPRPQIGFNYLGRVTVAHDQDWSFVTTAGPVVAASDPDMPLPHALELAATCLDGPEGPELVATWTWAPTCLSEQEVRELAELWFSSLDALTGYAEQQKTGSRSPSDLPLVTLSQSELDDLEAQWEL